MSKLVRPKVVVAGPCYGELFWEFFRFAPYIFTIMRDNPELKLIVHTRRERYDIYGEWAHEFISLNIPKIDNTFPDCFRLTNLSEFDKIQIEMDGLRKINEKYDIIYCIRPDISNNQFCNKNQYPMQMRLFDYKVRKENVKLVDKMLDPKKPIIVLAPRFRKNFKRNWPYWNELYDMLYFDKSLERFQFVICGKTDEMYVDPLKRFIDINDFVYSEKTSLIGVTIEILKRAKLTIGSQSAIPNISLIMGTPVLQWGNQKDLHTKTYNIYKTQVEFIEDMDFKLDAKIVFDKAKQFFEKIK